MKDYNFDFKSYVNNKKINVEKDFPQISFHEIIKKRKKARSFIQKTTTIAREMFNIYYMLARKKDKFSIALAALSTYNVIDEIIENEQKGPAEYFRKINAIQIFNDMSVFIYRMLKKLNINNCKIWESESSDGNKIIEEFDIGEKIYFYIEGENSDNNKIDGPWVLDKNKFILSFSNLIKKELGPHLLADTIKNGWNYSVFISDIKLDTKIYVGHIDENEFLNNINKFYEKEINRSLLFYGPPGCGKTTLAARISDKMNGRLFVISPKVLQFVDFSSLEMLIEILDPSVILFDDMDRMWNPEEMLGNIEQLNKKVKDRKRLIIATVNNIESIPDALRRPGRFDEIIEFYYPNNNERRNIINAYIDFFKVKMSESELNEMILLTEGMTAAYLREIVLRTSIIGFNLMPKQIMHMRKIAKIPDLTKKNNNNNNNNNNDNDKVQAQTR